MTFKLLDLVRAGINQRKDVYPTDSYLRKSHILRAIDFDRPYHAIMHHKTDKLVTISKYKDTVKLLSDLQDLRPIYDVAHCFFENDPPTDMQSLSLLLTDNIALPYVLKATLASKSKGRYVSEIKPRIFYIEKCDLEFDDSLPASRIVEIRLKSAALDVLYDRINWQRKLLEEDLIGSSLIYTMRYQQALRFLDGYNGELPLLKSHARKLDVDMMAAAKHCLFCYEEDSMTLAMSEDCRSTIEHEIMEAKSLDDLGKILFRLNYSLDHHL